MLSQEARVSDGPVTAPKSFGLCPWPHFLLLLSVRERHVSAVSAGTYLPRGSRVTVEGTGASQPSRWLANTFSWMTRCVLCEVSA